MVKKISRLEYRLNEIIGRPDLNEDCEPRTRLEEEQDSNKRICERLKTFNDALTGEPLFPELQQPNKESLK